MLASSSERLPVQPEAPGAGEEAKKKNGSPDNNSVPCVLMNISKTLFIK